MNRTTSDASFRTARASGSKRSVSSRPVSAKALGAQFASDQETMFEEIQHLKVRINDLEEMLVAARGEASRRGRELERKERLLESLMSGQALDAATQRQVQKWLSGNETVRRLRERVHDLEAVIQEKTATVAMLEDDSKKTRVDELKATVVTYYNECKRLQQKLERAKAAAIAAQGGPSAPPMETQEVRHISARELRRRLGDRLGLPASAFPQHEPLDPQNATYHIRITTSEQKGAGTSANVSVKLYGDLSPEGTDWIYLETSPDNFRRGRLDEFYVEGRNVGQVDGVLLRHDNSGGAADWLVEKVIVENEAHRSKTVFICGKWLKGDPADSVEMLLRKDDDRTADPTTYYRVVVMTGRVRGAGTDANVFISLFGENGSLSKQELESRVEDFEKGSVDEFRLKSDTKLGEISHIVVEHDNSGDSAAWYLEKIMISEVDEFGDASDRWVFPCKEWLDKPETDGFVRMKIPASPDVDEESKTAEYTVEVQTGTNKGAGTSADVVLTMIEADGDGDVSERFPLENHHENFSRGRLDTFKVRWKSVDDMECIVLAHDNSNDSPDWFVSSVRIRNNENGRVWFFPCGTWISQQGDADTETERLARKHGKPPAPHWVEKTLHPSASADGSIGQSVVYEVEVETGDVRGAGTDANVTIDIIGSNGSTGDRRLDNNKNNFERGRVDTFLLDCSELGRLQKIRIGHDGSGFGSGWFLERVTVTNKVTSEKWVFVAQRWLDEGEDDGSTVVDLVPSDGSGLEMKTYHVKVYTSDVRGAGTDANVHLQLYGSKGDSGLRKLDNSKNNFERGNVDVFEFTCADVGDLEKVFIGHDNSGFGAAWHLQKVIVSVYPKASAAMDGSDGALKKDKPKGTKSKQKQQRGPAEVEITFPCGMWFATSEGDGEVERFLYPEGSGKALANQGTTYVVQVHTADRRGAGTDANVTLQIFGKLGHTNKKRLDNSSNNFERGCIDEFRIPAPELGDIEKIVIGHDNSGLGPGWFLDKVTLKNEETSKEYIFPCMKWFSKDEGDKLIERTLLPVTDDSALADLPTTYLVQVATADRKGAGTDANVYIDIVGEHGATGKRILESGKNDFERGHCDPYRIESPDLGDLQKIRIGHDNSGLGPGWMLDKVIIKNETTGKTWSFPCMRWFDKKEDDGLIERELLPSSDLIGGRGAYTTYHVTVVTGDRKGAGTDANVSITMFGEKGDSGAKELSGGRSSFERGSVDEFRIECIELGPLTKVKVGHDGSWFASSWFLDKVTIRNETTLEEWVFQLNDWIEKKKGVPAEKMLFPLGEGGEITPPTVYTITTVTGNERGAGTDANVFITLYGEKGNTGERQLENDRNNFEKGRTDEFRLECDALGAIQKIRIWHDNSGLFGSAWYLDRVTVKNESSGEEWVFTCRKWFDKKSGDKQIVRELVPDGTEGAETAESEYQVHVITGDVSGAGTDANVFLIIFGENGDSGTRQLSKKGKNLFERGQTDDFVIKAIDLGELSKVRVWHDNGMFGSSWYLDEIRIFKTDNPDDVAVFPCGKWLSKKNGDGRIERELLRKTGDNEGGEFAAKMDTDMVKYEILVETSNVQWAGTDGDVFMTLIGEKGDTGERKLTKSGKNLFERGSTDDFTWEAVDLGPLQKIRIRVESWVPGSKWHLKEIRIKRAGTDDPYATFAHGDWVTPSGGVVVLTADTWKSQDSVKAKDEVYSVEVTTGSKRGSGTDANVFITLYGEHGDSGERKMKKGRNDTERGKVATFDIDTTTLGSLQKLKVRHDGTGWGAGWFLDQILVTEKSTGKKWAFPCNRWLAKDEDDGHIERVLQAEEKDA
eukprot:Rmarinus@m.27357